MAEWRGIVIDLGEVKRLSGLLEGEGCFLSHRNPRYRGGGVTITIGMTDADVIEWAALILGATSRQRPPTGLGKKPVYYATVSGAAAAAWMMTLYPLMGVRRRAAIRRALMLWCETPHVPRGTLTAECHPDRPHWAKRKCRDCYEAAYNRIKRERYRGSRYSKASLDADLRGRHGNHARGVRNGRSRARREETSRA